MAAWKRIRLKTSGGNASSRGLACFNVGFPVTVESSSSTHRHAHLGSAIGPFPVVLLQSHGHHNVRFSIERIAPAGRPCEHLF